MSFIVYAVPHPNHKLELALRIARKGGWDGLRFIVPDTFEASRFGVEPGRYAVGQKSGGIIRTACQRTLAGDLLLK